MQKLGRDGAVPLANSLSLADKIRMAQCSKQAKGKEHGDVCPFRHGELGGKFFFLIIITSFFFPEILPWADVSVLYSNGLPVSFEQKLTVLCNIFTKINII